MAEPLYELLVPYFDSADAASRPPPPPSSDSTTTGKYLNRISTLSLTALKSTEPQSLAQFSHSNLLSLQALANRSHKAFILSADNHSSLRTSIPKLSEQTQSLRDAIPKLDEEAVQFSSTYSKSAENDILDRRKRAMQLARNVDRLSDILELPTLLATAVSSSSVAAVGTGAGTGTGAGAGPGQQSSNYSSALDLFAHIRRLHSLYPDSALMNDISRQADDAIKDMASNLIAGLRVQTIRLPAAMRTVGWLRRVAPELESTTGPLTGAATAAAAHGEGAMGALFLVCRLANLITMLDALGPLRELADQETNKRLRGKQTAAASNGSSSNTNGWSGGQQTERFLKRYIEIYREQSFAIISLYKNIFAPAPSSESDSQSTTTPAAPRLNLQTAAVSAATSRTTDTPWHDPLSRLPPALATFPMHLAQMLTETLQKYLPNVRDKPSRESLLTQVLYCAGSLARLGGDFSMILSLLDEDDDDGDGEDDDETDGVWEWEEVMKKHRMLAERLDRLTASNSNDTGSKSISRVTSPSQS